MWLAESLAPNSLVDNLHYLSEKAIPTSPAMKWLRLGISSKKKKEKKKILMIVQSMYADIMAEV